MSIGFASGALSTARGCGTRTAGGLYLEVAESPLGMPLENFLLCPPVAIDMEKLRLHKVGMNLFEQPGTGVYHIADWVGEEFYPSPLDFLAEGDLISFSRRIPSTFPFSKLSKESRYIPIHPRGWIENFATYFNWEPPGMPQDIFGCLVNPRHLPSADEDDAEMCIRFWRQDISEGWAISNETIQGKSREYMERFGQRDLPCGGSYYCLKRPDGVTPIYKPAMIASLPIGRFVAVKAKDDSHKVKMEKAAKGPFSVQEVDF